MTHIALIPARGGSKRLPRKNILPFLGKPMLLWTCEAAQASGYFDHVVVSTEDESIAVLVREQGFDVLHRPGPLASDTASCVDVCLHALSHYEQRQQKFDILCCLYATAPLRTAAHIQATMQLLLDDPHANAAFAVCHYSHPPHQMLLEDTEGYLLPGHPLLANLKSQQVPPALIDNGSTYAMRTDALRRYKTFHMPRIRAHVMPRMNSVDIDTLEDMEIAQCFANYINKNKDLSCHP